MKRYHYLILALISNTLFRFHPFDFYFGDPKEFHTGFAVGQAISWLFLLAYVKDKLESKVERVIYDIIVWCAVSNLMDELFFDPIHLGINEVVFAVFIIGWTVVKYHPFKLKN